MNQPQYTECYVAYLDILGMKTLVSESERDPKLRTRLWNALLAIKGTYPYLSAQREADTGRLTEHVLRIQVLSDSVILFIPTRTSSIAWFLARIRRLYDQLVCLGFCLRGGIALGSMLWEEQKLRGAQTDDLDESARSSVALGPALVTAYLLESEMAIYPRILLSDDLCTHVKSIDFQNQHSERPGAHWIFPLASHDFHLGVKSFIKSDFDGLHFLDVLHKDIDRNDKIGGDGTPANPNRFDDTPRETWIERYRNVAVEGLGSAKDEKIRAKYAWLLNYVCHACKGQCPDQVSNDIH